MSIANELREKQTTTGPTKQVKTTNHTGRIRSKSKVLDGQARSLQSVRYSMWPVKAVVLKDELNDKYLTGYPGADEGWTSTQYFVSVRRAGRVVLAEPIIKHDHGVQQPTPR